MFQIPTATQTVWAALQEHYPHKAFAVEVQRSYLGNSLMLANYCPALRERIFLLAIERILLIDVRPPHTPFLPFVFVFVFLFACCFFWNRAMYFSL